MDYLEPWMKRNSSTSSWQDLSGCGYFDRFENVLSNARQSYIFPVKTDVQLEGVLDSWLLHEDQVVTVAKEIFAQILLLCHLAPMPGLEGPWDSHSCFSLQYAPHGGSFEDSTETASGSTCNGTNSYGYAIYAHVTPLLHELITSLPSTIQCLFDTYEAVHSMGPAYPRPVFHSYCPPSMIWESWNAVVPSIKQYNLEWSKKWVFSCHSTCNSYFWYCLKYIVLSCLLVRIMLE